MGKMQKTHKTQRIREIVIFLEEH